MDAHRLNFCLANQFQASCTLAPDRHKEVVYLVSAVSVHAVNFNGTQIAMYPIQHSWSCTMAAACDGFVCVASSKGCGVYTPTGTFYPIATVTNIIDVNVARGGIVYVVHVAESGEAIIVVVLKLHWYDHGLCLEQKWTLDLSERIFPKVYLTHHDEPLLLKWTQQGCSVSPLHDPDRVVGRFGPFSNHPRTTVCGSLLVTNVGGELMMHRLDGCVVQQHSFDSDGAIWALRGSDRYIFVAAWSTVYVYKLS